MKDMDRKPAPQERRLNDSRSDDGTCDTDDDDRKPPAREVVVPLGDSNSTVSSHPATTRGHNSGTYHRRRNPRSDDSTDFSSVATPFAVATPNTEQILIPPATQKLAPTDMTTGNATDHSGQMVSREEFQRQEMMIQTRIMFLSGGALFSMAAFMYIILPFSALICLITAAATSALAGRDAYQYAVSHFNDQARHGGFGRQLLPAWMFELLTQRTLHDFLMSLHERGDLAEMELRHILLYFMPGLTPEQRTAYIQRLPTRHRTVLEQPGGIGQMMGPSAMRFLVGDEEYERQQEQQQPGGRRRPEFERLDEESVEDERRAIERATPAAGLLDSNDSASSNSELGLEINASDSTGRLSDEQASSTMARGLRLPTDARSTAAESSLGVLSRGGHISEALPEEDDENDDVATEDENLEMRIIMEAAMDTVIAEVQRFFEPIQEQVQSQISNVSRQAAAMMASYGTRIALATGGLGLTGYVAASYFYGTSSRGAGGPRMSLGGLSRDLVSTSMFRSGLASGGPDRTRSFFGALFWGSGSMGSILFAANRMLLRGIVDVNGKPKKKKDGDDRSVVTTKSGRGHPQR